MIWSLVRPPTRGQGPAAIGYGDGDQNFVGARGIVHANFHCIEMAADEGGVFVAERNIDCDAEAVRVFSTRELGRAFAEYFADGCAEFGVENGSGVLEFTVFADRGGFAVTFGGRPGMPRATTARSVSSAPKFFADLHEFSEVLNEFSSERIFDHGCGGSASCGRIHRLAHFGVSFFQEDNNFANFGFHRRPSSPLISEAFRPPTRAWMRGPVVITRAKRISSARGASAMPTSMESKWLRT